MGFQLQRYELLGGRFLHGFRFRLVENHIFFRQLSSPASDKWCPRSPNLGDTDKVLRSQLFHQLFHQRCEGAPMLCQTNYL